MRCNQTRLSKELLPELAGKLRLDATKLNSALEDGTFAGRVGFDLESGEKSGVEGTPTFYINGTRHDGGSEASELIEAIEEATDAAMQG